MSAALFQFPGNVTVVDGDLSFGDIGAGTMVQSSDTFTIRVDRRIATLDRDLKWRLSYTVAGVPVTITLVIPWL